MAIEHARICGACERECPSWASRCPACGSMSVVHRIVIVSSTQPVTALSDATQPRKRSRRARVAGHEPPRTSPARSTA
jgi:predicted ATP-dependent serine protease